MNPQKGFTIQPRKFFTDELWLERRKFSRAEAWLDLIQAAQYEDKPELLAWDRVKLQRGQLITSLQRLSERWGRSKTWIKSCLAYLSKRESISYEKRTRFLLITICKYDEYQNLESYKSTKIIREKHETFREKTRDVPHTNKVNKVNKESSKRESEFSEEEMSKWMAEENQVRDHWNENLRPKCIKFTSADRASISSWLNVKTESGESITVEQIIHGIDNYKTVTRAKRGEYSWTYASWSLKHFMQRGLERFMDDSFVEALRIVKKRIIGAPDGKERAGRIQ